jgi:hypothetical protein
MKLAKARELVKADSTQIQIDLPLQMEGTDYLIHPDLSIGTVRSRDMVLLV